MRRLSARAQRNPDARAVLQDLLHELYDPDFDEAIDAVGGRLYVVWFFPTRLVRYDRAAWPLFEVHSNAFTRDHLERFPPPGLGTYGAHEEARTAVVVYP